MNQQEARIQALETMLRRVLRSVLSISDSLRADAEAVLGDSVILRRPEPCTNDALTKADKSKGVQVERAPLGYRLAIPNAWSTYITITDEEATALRDQLRVALAEPCTDKPIPSPGMLVRNTENGLLGIVKKQRLRGYDVIVGKHGKTQYWTHPEIVGTVVTGQASTERAAVVRWLTENSSSWAAECIERGDHLSGNRPNAPKNGAK